MTDEEGIDGDDQGCVRGVPICYHMEKVRRESIANKNLIDILKN